MYVYVCMVGITQFALDSYARNTYVHKISLTTGVPSVFPSDFFATCRYL